MFHGWLIDFMIYIYYYNIKIAIVRKEFNIIWLVLYIKNIVYKILFYGWLIDLVIWIYQNGNSEKRI